MVKYINPLKIKNRIISTFDPSVYTTTGTVISSAWDVILIPFSSGIAVEGIYERFIGGARWEDTMYYKMRKSGGYGEIKDVDGYMKSIDDLYFDMKENGYREPGYWRWHGTRQDIGVAITRKGEYVWCHDGQHRLAIAQILKIKKVPVRIVVRWK